MIRLLLINLLLMFMTTAVSAGEDWLTLVYPRDYNAEQQLLVPQRDSLFVLGHVQGGITELQLNGVPVPMLDGMFLHYDRYPGEQMEFIGFDGREQYHKSYYTAPMQYADIDLPPVAQQVQVIDPGASLKLSPRGTYFSFPRVGTRLNVLDRRPGMYEVELGCDRTGWIRTYHVQPCEPDTIRADLVSRALVQPTERGFQVRIHAGPQLTLESLQEDGQLLIIQYEQMVSNLDQIRIPQELADRMQIFWRQVHTTGLELRIRSLDDQISGWYTDVHNGEWTIDVQLQSRMRPLRRSEWLIVLDPGHGGEEWGAVGPGGTMEKDANLMLARRLQQKLVRRGYRVLLTRNDDRDLSLWERTRIARESGAQLFISLHFNAVSPGQNPWRDTQSSTYFYTPQSQAPALAIHRAILREVGLGDDGFNYRNLAVLRQTALPSVLVEGAYIIQPPIEQQLMQGDLLEHLARGIARGVDNYRKQDRPWWRF